MPPEEARKYLLSIRATLSETPGAHRREYVAAMDTALEALSPPKGDAHFAWAFIPAADMTPYEDLERAAVLSHRMDKILAGQEPALTLDTGEQRLVYIALVCYQSILRGLYRERALKEVENVMRELAEKGTGGGDTSCCQD